MLKIIINIFFLQFVLSSYLPNSNQNGNIPTLQKLHIISDIKHRYARTVVHSKYYNPNFLSSEANFSIVLPDDAFITDFVMHVNNKDYKAYVQEKQTAQNLYDAARYSGLSAAQVKAGDDRKIFEISVNLEPESTILFSLKYEELLARKLNKYTLKYNLNPGQLVDDFEIVVNIKENKRITDLFVSDLYKNIDAVENVQGLNDKYVRKIDLDVHGTNKKIIFKPTKSDQQELITRLSETNNLRGQFVVQYDVERNPDGNELLTCDGYFVHFLTPPINSKPIPKHVIFVLDVSGSMRGEKLNQLRDAMQSILADLNEKDCFNIIKFDTNIYILNNENVWSQLHNPEMSAVPFPVNADLDKIVAVKEVISSLSDSNSLTNIHDALLVALRMSNSGWGQDSVIIFLTDGQANMGETNTEKTLSLIKYKNDKNEKPTKIYTIGFGNDVNDKFLKQLADDNSGFRRKIHLDTNPKLSLKNFYAEISSPMLNGIQYKYNENAVSDVFVPKANILYKGSELVTVGKSTSGKKNFTIDYTSFEGRKTLHVTNHTKSECIDLKRMWAYLSIKRLLNKKDAAAKVTAMNLALEYSFVTSVTSLIVIKPSQQCIMQTNCTDSVLHFDVSASPTGYVPAQPGHKDMGKFYVPKVSRPITTKFQTSGTVYPDSRPTVQVSHPITTKFETSGTVYPNFWSTFQVSHPITTKFETSGTVYPDFMSTVQDTSNFWFSNISWLKNYFRDEQKRSVNFNNTIYFVGDSNLSFEVEDCNVKNTGEAGHCELLINCPAVYSKLNTYDTYINNYFCPLKEGHRLNYLAVCCV